jgi:hypothetical protein
MPTIHLPTIPLTIDYPLHDGDKVDAANGKAFTLIVHGKDTKDKKNKIAKATLTPQGGAALDGIVKKQPQEWAVIFRIAAVNTAIPYSVHIEDSQHPKQTADRTFSFQNPPLHTHLDPASGSTVHGSGFSVSFPNPGPNLSAYAYMNQPGGPTYMGTPIEQSPVEIWFFQNIPAGTDYTISSFVWDNPPHVTTSTDITVINP